MNIDTTTTVKATEQIITQGEMAQCAYRILEGEAEVTMTKNERTVTLATLGEGAIFGEMALFDATVYGADVTAKTDCTLEIITPQSFQEKLEGCDPTLRAILEMMSDRLRKTNKALLESETREFMDLVLI